MTVSGLGRGRVIAIRHGETEWSRSGRHTSRTDVPLTDAGRTAATRVAARLHGQPFTHVLSSPRRRAIETASLAGFAETMVIDPDLAEWDYGAYEGLTTPAIRLQRAGWSIWEHGVPGGETAAQVAERADRVIARARSRGGDVLMFSHAHFLRVLAARWIGLPATEGRHFALSTASVSVLGWQREDPVVELWNDSAHLDPMPRGDWDRSVVEPAG